MESFYKVGAIALLLLALGLGAPAPALAAGVLGYFAGMLLLEWFLASRARSQERDWVAMPRWQLLVFSFVALVVGVIGRAAWQFDWSSISRNRWIALIIAVIALAATVAAWTRHSAHEGWTFAYMGGASFRDALWIAFLMPLIAPLAFLAAMFYFVAGDEVEAHARQVELQGSMCGASSASPERIAPASWSGYACREQSAAGELWDECLPRRAYTGDRGAGCPGKERCCPPAGRAKPASSAPHSMCGAAKAVPDGMSSADWARHVCKARSDAAGEWGQCLPRKTYTARAGAGCPGKERCCPE